MNTVEIVESTPLGLLALGTDRNAIGTVSIEPDPSGSVAEVPARFRATISLMTGVAGLKMVSATLPTDRQYRTPKRALRRRRGGAMANASRFRVFAGFFLSASLLGIVCDRQRSDPIVDRFRPPSNPADLFRQRWAPGESPGMRTSPAREEVQGICRRTSP